MIKISEKTLISGISDLIRQNGKTIFSSLFSKSISVNKVRFHLKSGEKMTILLKTALDLHGEWWIDDSGNAMFADGDVGDANHEILAAQRVTADFLNYFNIYAEEVAPLSEYQEEIWNYIVSNGFVTKEEAENEESGKTKEDFENDPYPFILTVMNRQTTPQLEKAFGIAWGSNGHDVRDYAMQYLGWKRMVGRQIESWSLTSEDLRNIVSGINEAYGYEMEEEGSDQTEFTIEVRANRSFYSVPLNVLERVHSPAELGDYRSRY